MPISPAAARVAGSTSKALRNFYVGLIQQYFHTSQVETLEMLRNPTQFSAVDSAARFDAAGNQVNTRLGQVTGARSACHSISIKFQISDHRPMLILLNENNHFKATR